jgi:hypothetical protein
VIPTSWLRLVGWPHPTTRMVDPSHGRTVADCAARFRIDDARSIPLAASVSRRALEEERDALRARVSELERENARWRGGS